MEMTNGRGKSLAKCRWKEVMTRMLQTEVDGIKFEKSLALAIGWSRRVSRSTVRGERYEGKFFSRVSLWHQVLKIRWPWRLAGVRGVSWSTVRGSGMGGSSFSCVLGKMGLNRVNQVKLGSYCTNSYLLLRT